MTRAPFGRRPRRAGIAGGRPVAVQINWQPCRGGCGARTLDGELCQPCLRQRTAPPPAPPPPDTEGDHAVDCAWRNDGECDCNFEGRRPTETP